MSSTLEKRRCDDLGAFVCGWGAAFVNIIVTFPMTKLMFRQMLHGVPTKGALDQLRHEGLATLYRGCLPPLFQKTISVSIMFGTFHSFSNSIRENFPGSSKVSVTFFAGMMAGSTEALLTPLERVQALLQDRQHHHRFKNTAAVVKFLRPYGLREYYRGVVPILLRNGPSTFLFFTLRDQVKGVLPLNHSELWQAIVSDFVSGAVVGALVSTIAYPLNVVKTIMQVQYGPPRPSFWSVLKKTRAERKTLRKMLYGVHINYTRALMSWGIINACYELFTAEYGKHFGAERDLK